MSFVIQGPYPNMITSLLLPSPNVGNARQLRSSIQTLRTMNGTLFTYVKPKQNRKLHRWDFLSSKEKGLETKEFAEKYSGGLVRVTDHEGTIRIGYITINPLETQGQGRAGGWADIEEAVSFTIEFEEKV